MNISGFTEQQAREKIGSVKCAILDHYGFYWSEQLPYSCMEGWTNASCSFIFDEDVGLHQTEEQMVEHIIRYGNVKASED